MPRWWHGSSRPCSSIIQRQRNKDGGCFMRIRRLPILFGIILTLICAGRFLAQSSTGSIRGAVTDPAGAVLPSATIIVKNLDTNLERKLITNEEGLYNADNHQPCENEDKCKQEAIQTCIQPVP